MSLRRRWSSREDAEEIGWMVSFQMEYRLAHNWSRTSVMPVTDMRKRVVLNTSISNREATSELKFWMISIRELIMDFPQEEMANARMMMQQPIACRLIVLSFK